MRVDFTRLRVIEEKNLRVDLTSIRVESTRRRVAKKTTTQKKLSTRLVPVDLWFMCIMMSLK
jgi:hypothetical protein